MYRRRSFLEKSSLPSVFKNVLQLTSCKLIFEIIQLQQNKIAMFFTDNLVYNSILNQFYISYSLL